MEPDYNQTLTVGTLGRNTARGPIFHQWDLSAMKFFPLTERVKLQARIDLFNLLNHPNFGNPDTGLCSAISLPTAAAPAVCTPNPNFGRSGSTISGLIGTGTSRQAQIALKLVF